MKRRLHLISILTGVSFLLNAQSVDTLTISPIVGNVIDAAEKKQHYIFPYYSQKTFIQAVFIQNTDSTIVLRAKLEPDSIAERLITKLEYDWIKNMIQADLSTPPALLNKSNALASCKAGHDINTELDDKKRKWSFSVFAGFSLMDPGKDIENKMEEAGFGAATPGGQGFFGYFSGSDYPKRKTGMVWIFETGYTISKKSALNFTAGKISHASVKGYNRSNYLTIISDLWSASFNYVWRIGRDNNGFSLGPVIAGHNMGVKDPGQYYYNNNPIKSSTSSTIKAGFNLGCNFSLFRNNQKRNWFLGIKANYTWLPDAEIGPYTKHQTSVFEKADMRLSTINLGLTSNWRI